MKKTAILVDSTITVPDEFKKREDIFVVPLSINFEDVSYKDVGDPEKLTKEITERIEREKKIPKTSQPSAQNIIDKLDEIQEKGFERVIGLFISSGLSGTVQGAMTASKMFLEERPDIDLEIDIFDTKFTSLISFISVKDILMRIDNKEDINNEEIQKIIDFYIKNMKVLFVVDNLDYLAYGGRIRPTLAAMGNLFGVKPIITIKEGKLEEYTKVRSNKKAIDLMLKEFEEYNEKYQDLHFGVIHVLEGKGASKLLNYANKISKNGKSEYEKPEAISSVVGNHTGPGTIALLFTPKYKN